MELLSQFFERLFTLSGFWGVGLVMLGMLPLICVNASKRIKQK